MEVYNDGAGGRAVEAAVELVHHLDERGFRDLDGADGGLARLPVLARRAALVARLVVHLLQVLRGHLERLDEDGVSVLVQGHLHGNEDRLHHEDGVLVCRDVGGAVAGYIGRDARVLALPAEEDADCGLVLDRCFRCEAEGSLPPGGVRAGQWSERGARLARGMWATRVVVWMVDCCLQGSHAV